jgi:hypothetical protein
MSLADTGAMNATRSVRPLYFALLLVSTLWLSCASTPGARPDDMSAEEHRAHAQDEEAKAEQHQVQFDPNAAPEPDLRQAPALWDIVTYNPTEVHIEHARKHREHADDHRQAAADLEEFEEAKCKSFPAQTRKLCPLVGTVETVADIDGGVKVRLSEKVNAEAALAHVRCHLAYGRKQGRKGMDRCPLYLQGVAAKAGADKQMIELTTEEAADVSELRKRTREHVSP